MATLRYALAFVLTYSLVGLTTIKAAHAGMIGTSEVVQQLRLTEEREKVTTFLQRDEVRAELVKFGVTPAEADQRLASLSEEEVRQLAGQIDQGSAGGDIIVIGLTTILLVVIILLLLGKI